MFWWENPQRLCSGSTEKEYTDAFSHLGRSGAKCAKQMFYSWSATSAFLGIEILE